MRGYCKPTKHSVVIASQRGYCKPTKHSVVIASIAWLLQQCLRNNESLAWLLQANEASVFTTQEQRGWLFQSGKLMVLICVLFLISQMLSNCQGSAIDAN